MCVVKLFGTKYLHVIFLAIKISSIVLYQSVSFLFQLSLAARVTRDTDTATKAEAEDVNSFNLNDAFSKLTQELQKAFSQENVEVSRFFSIHVKVAKISFS